MPDRLAETVPNEGISDGHSGEAVLASINETRAATSCQIETGTPRCPCGGLNVDLMWTYEGIECRLVFMEPTLDATSAAYCGFNPRLRTYERMSPRWRQPRQRFYVEYCST